ncbi:MAG: exodeoxyribonuclease VII large subunit [Candidatus Rokuibacteriota bacterium]|nr:MAG: exodeoxyribonuclease VII large subunit [Candidatus Rokubacteria bacterium]
MGDRQVYTVSQLTARIRDVLEEQVAPFWVEGEISNLRVPGSGHAYFTLKDDAAQIRVVLFRNRLRRIRFEPADGLHVLAFGALEVYAPRGEYQMVVELMEPKGLGALQVAFEQLKARLQAEGLFDPGRKRPLPRFPRKIGIVTSPTGAAIRDMLRVIGRRFGELHIVVRPVRVQGEGSAREIAEGIADLNALGDVDVIIAGRGGGSLEDLWAFNEEVVARAIVGSKAPVMSAVGHEVDFTIADFVADLRAPTPSAAAELVVREKEAVVDGLRDLHHRLSRALARRLERQRERLVLYAERRVLSDPSRPLRDAQRRLDELGLRLSSALGAGRRHAVHRLALATQRLHSGNPAVRISSGRGWLGQLQGRLDAGARRSLDRSVHGFRVAAGKLDGLSPLAVLGRGYSLTRTASGEIVRSADQVAPRDPVSVLLHEGTLECTVEETRERDGRPQV